MQHFNVANTSEITPIATDLHCSNPLAQHLPKGKSTTTNSLKNTGMKKFLYTLALTALFAIGATAQGFQLRILPRFPAGANVCAEMNDTIVVKNIFASGTTNIKLTPTFPPGMTYVPGSITVLNGGAVTEFNISNLNKPIFSLPNLPGVNDSVTYVIAAKTDCGILDYLLASGGAATVTMRANYAGNFDTYPATGGTPKAIDIFAPSILIQTIAPAVIPATNGTVAYRDITFLNGGYGYTTAFRFLDNHTGAISIDSFSKGTIGVNNSSVTELFIDTNVIKQFGDGDIYFELNEQIVVREYLHVLNCNTSGGSNFEVMWGCSPGTYCDTTNNVANVNIGALTPNVVLQSIKNNYQSCNGPGFPNHKIVVYRNNGTAPAKDLTQYLQMAYVNGGAYPYNNYWNANTMDTASFKIKIGANGTFIHLSPDSVWKSNPAANHFEYNPVYPTYSYVGDVSTAYYDFGALTLKPGDSLIMEWDMYTECQENPNENAGQGGDQYDHNWNSQLDYTDPCDFYKYIVGPYNGYYLQRNHWGGGVLQTPSDMADNQVAYGVYDFNSSTGFVYLTGAIDSNTAYYEFALDYQAGTQWDASAVDSLVWLNVNTGKSVKPFYVADGGCGGRLVARFLMRDLVANVFSSPGYYNGEKGETYTWGGDWTGTSLKWSIKASCGCGGANTSAKFRLYTVQDASCACRRASTGMTSYTIKVHCPGCDTIAIVNQFMDVRRANYGIADNNNDGRPDDTGSLDFSKVAYDKSTMGDTLKATLVGYVLGDPTEPSFIPGFTGFRADIICPNTDFDALYAKVTIRKGPSGGSVYVMNNVPATMVGNRARVDITYTALQALNPALPGGLLTDEDSIAVETYILNRIFIGGTSTVQYTFGSDFYGYCGQPNPYAGGQDNWACDNWSDNHQIAGFSFYNPYSDNGPVTINGCNAYSYWIYNQNQIGGSWEVQTFPFEYRNLGRPFESRVILPAGYVIDTNSTYLQYYNFNANRGSFTPGIAQAIAIPFKNVAINGDTAIFNWAEIYKGIGTLDTMTLPDDGFLFYTRVYVTPSCAVTPDVS